MSMITAERLNRYLSSPIWKPEQWDEAVQLCEEIEHELSASLNMAPISPRGPVTEVADVTDRGLVLARWPVHHALILDALVIDEGDPLPAGWSLNAGYLSTTAYALLPATMSRNIIIGSIAIQYMAGWGDQPALRSALLRKLRAIWLNRHDNQLTARGVNGEAPTPLPETWTPSELRQLSAFYWHNVTS